MATDGPNAGLFVDSKTGDGDGVHILWSKLGGRAGRGLLYAWFLGVVSYITGMMEVAVRWFTRVAEGINRLFGNFANPMEQAFDSALPAITGPAAFIFALGLTFFAMYAVKKAVEVAA